MTMMAVCAMLINFSLHKLCVDHTQHLDNQLCCVTITERIILKLHKVIEIDINTQPMI